MVIGKSPTVVTDCIRDRSTYAVPARYFLVALRGIVLKGSPLSHFILPLAALSIYAAAVLGLASLRLARERA